LLLLDTQALEAYGKSYSLVQDTSKSNADYRTAIAEISRRMTREQQAEHMMIMLNDFEARGRGFHSQSDKISHIDAEDDRIDTVICRIISPYPISISRMTITIW
jgi:hypothetical protein